MKKLSLLAIVATVALLTACEGDNPSGGSGTLEPVTGLEILATSAGNVIDLAWNEYAGSESIDGYEVYFKPEATGSTWTALGTTTTTGYEHTASVAGSYAVRAYEGDNYSSSYGTEVSTMPNIVSTIDTIYDNNATSTYPSGYIFGWTQGTPGLAGDADFHQDIYAFDNEYPVLGDLNVAFKSGSWGDYPGGNPTYMYDPDGTYGYCPVWDGTTQGPWWSNYTLYTTDEVVFGHLYDGVYVKIYIDAIFPETTEHGTGVDLHYEIQPLEGVTVFTDDH